MTDYYGKAQPDLQMQACVEGVQKKQGVEAEEQVPPCLLPSPVLLDEDASGIPPRASALACKHTTECRSTTGKDCAQVGKHLSKVEKQLLVKGAAKVLHGKWETNGNYATIHHPSSNIHSEEGGKLAKKRRPVSVDTSKAKTSLEAVKMSIKQLKWKEFPSGRRAPCDIYWHGVSFHDNDNIVSGQVNKFPGMVEMSRKINLSRSVRTMQELFPEEYDFYPQSWILPEEYQQFSTQIRMVKENDATLNPTFIVKPDSGSQGDGIYLIRDPAELRLSEGAQAKQAVVQEYIQKPLLVDKLKFDIRLYVLLKSLEPLEIYIAKEGLTRFCTEPYQEPSQKNLGQVFMHLTNYSLNVHSGNFVHSDSQSTGSKRTLSSVLHRLAAKGVDIKRVWSDIIALVIKTIIAVVPELKVYYQADIPPGKPGPTCFQILGFDILLMKNLKPVLLEVNSNPSMRIEHEQEVAPGVFECVNSPVDEEVKVGVIRDTLRLVDPGLKKTSTSQVKAGGEEAPVEARDRNQQEGGTMPSPCLKQVYPKYNRQFNYLRLVERIAALFIRFLGVKGNMRLGPTAFRTFIRNCKLSSSNFTMASVDILYIDIARRWSGALPDSREAGMGLQAFVEAFLNLAARRFKSQSSREQALSLLELCEAQLESQPGAEERRSVSCGRSASRGVKNPSPANPRLVSPTPLRRASSQDYRLNARLKPRTLRANVEN
ncbi:tubulin polyglutamylase TTLL11 isoform X1 [Dunckerocampus dactyliophorus]|uniref:tubulin polyglutamylase TTLL11 isoform X1 n=1 Tax=Dunckerocampus dactyliophorus TaxID=161453 RepID=UPI0024069AF2|nr:tubulin polyglutamylase TTLL11 isoform X1 [Dunckerocampus dactyliophorus]XP_054613959.1 tubulin polyglutamylase TTLL11 isoform X1 [Dunckerocampus dactyliophorus]